MIIVTFCSPMDCRNGISYALTGRIVRTLKPNSVFCHRCPFASGGEISVSQA
jgi:hypothetical protein